MMQLLSIVKLTIKEIIQGRIFSLSIILGIFFSLISIAASEISYGNKPKIYFDIGLGFLFFSIMILSTFFGSSSFSKGNDEGSLYIILPKLKNRSYYLIGKIIGYFSVIFLEFVFLSAFILAIYKYVGGVIDYGILLCLLFILLSSLLIFMISLTFSHFASHFLAFFLSVAVYLIGYGLPNTLEIASVNKMSLFSEVLKICTFVFPNFFVLDIKEAYLYRGDFDIKFILQAILNTFIYSTILILLNLKIFKRKNF